MTEIQEGPPPETLEVEAAQANPIVASPATKDVELPLLKRANGDPVVVTMRRLSRVEFARYRQGLSGPSPDEGGGKDEAGGSERLIALIRVSAVTPRIGKPDAVSDVELDEDWLSVGDIEALSAAVFDLNGLRLADGARFPA